MGKNKNIAFVIIRIIALISSILLILKGVNIQNERNNSGILINQQLNQTGLIEYSGLQSVIVFSGEIDFSRLGSGRYTDQNNFPKIKIGTGEINYAELRITLDFNEWYKKNYWGKIQGLTSDGKPARYIFALRYFLGNFDHGGYVDVYRTKIGTVENDIDEGLLGGYYGYEIIGGKEFIIPLQEVKVARGSGEYGYKIIKSLNYINENKGNIISVGGRLSDWNGVLLKKIEIIYSGSNNLMLSIP